MRFPDLLVQVNQLERRIEGYEFDIKQLVSEVKRLKAALNEVRAVHKGQSTEDGSK